MNWERDWATLKFREVNNITKTAQHSYKSSLAINNITNKNGKLKTAVEPKLEPNIFKKIGTGASIIAPAPIPTL